MSLPLDRTDEAIEDDHWIGPAPSAAGIAAMLLIGSIGIEIIGVQPVVLGALVEARRLSVAGLGWATTAELLTFGLTTSVAGALLRPRRLKVLTVLAALSILAADLLVMRQAGLAIVINRGAAGIAEGLMYWIPSCLVARSSTPARWAGIFLTLQGVTQLAFTALVPLTIMARYGANGGFAALAGTAALALVATPLIPSALADLPAGPKGDVVAVFSSPVAVGSLLSVFLISAFSIGLFAYLAPLSTQAHLDPKILGFAVSGVLASSIVGSAVAAAAAKLISYYPVFIVSLVVNAAVIAVLYALPGPTTFIVAASVFGFFWVFFLPFQLPMIIAADPTRRVAVSLPGAQLLGGAFGPFLCSLFVSDTDARGALWVSGVCFFIAFGLSTILRLTRRRTFAPA